MARSASLPGDHWEQHYPWAYLFADSLKHFKFPFWTPLIHCGFPITAESQIGLFYLPNMILYLFLPFHWAYSYLNVFHFALAGIATYLYARQMLLRPGASFVAAFIFTFGAAYGGAFYNLISLKTIAWFPLTLFLFERFLSQRKTRDGVLLAFSIALSLLAGYLQVALLALLIFLIYVFLRIFVFSEPSFPRSWAGRFKASFLIGWAVAGAFLLALPQLFLTFQLAMFSNRIDLTEDYAYVGSLNPISLITLIFPKFQGFLRGNSLYCGIFPVFLMLGAIGSKEARRSSLFRLAVGIGLVSFLLALGEWSPLYIGLIKLTHFYSFRTPAKFIVFVCFAIALLAGLGLQTLQDSTERQKGEWRKTAGVYVLVLATAFASYGILYYLATAGQPVALKISQWAVSHFIYGRSGHPHSLTYYYGQLPVILENLRSMLTLTQPWNLWTFFVISMSLLFITGLTAFPKKKLFFLLGAWILTIGDLYVYAWMDIKRDFDSYEKVLAPQPIVEFLKGETAKGSVGRIYGFRKEGEELPLVPNVNMIYGFEDIGAYSPFVMRRYHETVGLFGNVNDSNHAFSPTPEFVLERLPLLSSLDVSHILSTHPLKHSDFELLMENQPLGVRLYRNRASRSRVHFVSQVEIFPDWDGLKKRLMEPGFDPRKTLLLEKAEAKKIGMTEPPPRAASEAVMVRKTHTETSEIWKVEVKQSGFFVWMASAYPGWQAFVNGQEAPILKAYGFFQAVRLKSPGSYEIRFSYSPFSSKSR